MDNLKTSGPEQDIIFHESTISGFTVWEKVKIILGGSVKTQVQFLTDHHIRILKEVGDARVSHKVLDWRPFISWGREPRPVPQYPHQHAFIYQPKPYYMNSLKTLAVIGALSLLFFAIGTTDAIIHDAKDYAGLSVIGKTALWLFMVPFTAMVVIFGVIPFWRWFINLVK